MNFIQSFATVLMIYFTIGAIMYIGICMYDCNLQNGSTETDSQMEYQWPKLELIKRSSEK